MLSLFHISIFLVLLSIMVKSIGRLVSSQSYFFVLCLIVIVSDSNPPSKLLAVLDDLVD